MSREEAEQEEQRRRSDDVRLQLALSQSQQDFKLVNIKLDLTLFQLLQSPFWFCLKKYINFRAPQTEKQSHMLDLLDVNLEEACGYNVKTDPWGIPITPPPPRPQVCYSVFS